MKFVVCTNYLGGQILYMVQLWSFLGAPIKNGVIDKTTLERFKIQKTVQN